MSALATVRDVIDRTFAPDTPSWNTPPREAARGRGAKRREAARGRGARRRGAARRGRRPSVALGAPAEQSSADDDEPQDDQRHGSRVGGQERLAGQPDHALEEQTERDEQHEPRPEGSQSAPDMTAVAMGQPV